MIELDRHIEILLLNYECVIVPGLGGFMTHHVDARYDEDDGLFLPPLRTLGFNPQLKLNDSLLAQSYVEAYDISYPEAVRRIEAEVDELKQHIENEGSYELNDIGVLSLNADGNYLFEPCEAGVLTPELYGLCSFEMRPCIDDAAEVASKSEAAPTKAIATRHKAATDEAESTDDEIEDSETADEERVIKIKVAWIRNAVAAVAAVIAFFVITPPISNSQLNTLTQRGLTGSFMPNVVATEPAETTSGADNVASLTAESASEATALSADEPAETAESTAESVAEPAESVAESTAAKAESPATKAASQAETAAAADQGGYCIVIASRVTKRNAQSYVEKLHAAGHSTASVYVSRGIVRVIYGSYNSEAEAYSVLRKVRENDEFEQAWVYRKR